MDGHIVFSKTSKGLEEIQTRKFRLPHKERLALILVDGVSDLRSLQRKAISVTDLAETLTRLTVGGFIQATDPIAQATLLRAANAEAPPADDRDVENARSRLLDALTGALGREVEPVARIILEAPSTIPGVLAAADRARKLMALTIDESRARNFAEATRRIMEPLVPVQAAASARNAPVAVQPAPASGPLTTAQVKSRMLEEVIRVLGHDVEQVSRKLREAPETSAGLTEAIDQGCRLVQLTIDEAKARELRQNCLELIGRLPA